MPDDIRISRKKLETALDALGERATPVYSAYEKKNGEIVLRLCGRTEAVTWSPPKLESEKEAAAQAPPVTGAASKKKAGAVSKGKKKKAAAQVPPVTGAVGAKKKKKKKKAPKEVS